MNQPMSPAIATRTPGHTDSPDILQVVRRYAVLLVLGTAVGAAVSGSLYWYLKRTYPLYKSSYQFQVLPPPSKLGDTGPLVINPDDTRQFIYRQVEYIKQESILREILRTKEFFGEPGSDTPQSKWYQENRSDPLSALRKDLQVMPMEKSASFEISFTCRSPGEAQLLVKSAKEVYMQHLQSDNTAMASRALATADKVLKDQRAAVDNMTQALNAFRQNLNVPALESRYTVELTQLQQMNTDLLRSESLENSAQAQLQTIKDLFEKGTLKDTPEAQQFVNEDGEFRQLHFQWLGYQQDKAALQAKTGASSSTIDMKMLEARISENEKQTEKLKDTLEKRAADRIMENVKNEYEARKAQADYIRGLRSKKEETFQSLDSNLNQYRQKAAEVKAQEEVLDKLRRDTQFKALSSGTDDNRVNLIVDAVQPDPKDFVWPNLYMFLSLGTLGGFGLSFLTAYLLAMSDTRVRTPRDITRTLQLPLLGFIPDESDDRALTGDVGTALLTSPQSMVAESFRQIRSQLIAQTENSPVNTLLVASIAPGGGSTTVASNLAVSMALNDRRVLLVDANFYRPSLKGLYKNLPAEGLSDALKDPSLLETAIVASPEVPKLHILGAGTLLAKGSSELLEGKAFRELLDSLKSKYDLIIFDGAPLNLVSDSLTLAARMDGVISIVRAGEVSRGTVMRIREQLRQVHANLLGFVLNAAQTSSSGYFKENYRTFYRYAGPNARRSPATKAR